MKILLSNDDGIYATGLRFLAEALMDIADIIIVAPDRNRSGASNSLTLEQPLRVKKVDLNLVAAHSSCEPSFNVQAFSVQGTPTDCVHFALTELCRDSLPDLVIAGINHGANLGDDTLYSGTVAAAMEGHFFGIQSLAFSLVGQQHFAHAANVARHIVKQHQCSPITPKRLLNINIPDCVHNDLSRYKITRLGRRSRLDSMIKQQDPRGNLIYWIGAAGAVQDGADDTDFHAIEQGYISVTPLTIDLTDHHALHGMDSWLTNVLHD